MQYLYFYNYQLKYYLNNILKLKDTKNNFNLFIGNIFHYILSKIYNEDFDFEKEYSTFIENEVISSKDSILLIKIKEILRNATLNIKNQYKYMNLKEIYTEESIQVELDDAIFNGKIDKIMIGEYKEEKYAIVVDYKTGNNDFNGGIENIKNGLNLQLPIYLYLLKNSEHFKDKKIAGFYLQKVYYESDENPDKKYYLDGYTINDDAIADIVCSCREDKSLSFIKETKKGSYIDLKDIEEQINIAEDKIKEAIKSILLADFKINPKKISKSNDESSCKNCPFKEICYVENKDYQLLQEDEEGDDYE